MDGWMDGQTMKRNSKPRCLRLSPNELQELVKQEKQKWRIFRIQQVREQAKQEAQRVREAVRRQERRMLGDLRQEVEAQWQVKKEQRTIQLEKEYQACLNNIGQAHQQAKQQPNADEILQRQAEHNHRLAAQRGQEAGKHQKEKARHQQHQKNNLMKQRQDVHRLEKLRARQVADLPVPKVFRKKIVKEKKPPQRVALHEAGTFTTSHYVPQNVRVEKEVWSSKPSAKEKAVVEEAERVRQQEAQQRQAEEERVRREQRGQEALKREHLTRLLEQLTAGLDEAQRQHQLSHFLHGKDGGVWEGDETRLKEQTHQQRQMEEAVEKLLQEEDKKEKKDEDFLGTGIMPEPSVQSSEYLEEIESSEDITWETTSKTNVRGLRSLLKEVERRRNRILQELEDSIPVRGPSGDGEGGSRRDQERDIHMAETVPVHLHPGHPTTRSLPQHPALSLPPSPQPEGGQVEAQPDTSEAPDSSSTVLPLSEESIPVSSDSTQFSTSPSLPHRFSTHQEQQTQRRDTHARQPQPGLSESCTATSDASSLNSENIKINIDLDVGSSSLVASDSSSEQPKQQQSKSYIISTEYYSLPSDIPGKVSIQEIEDNLRRIQEHRQRNQDFIDSLSRKRVSPGHHMPLTYLEKLKEDGSGKKPLTRKEKYELQKKELIRFYIQKLLQRGDEEGELSASTVESSGLSLSSLGSFLGYLEGAGQEDQPTISSNVTSASATSRSLSSYEDIDEFPVKLKPRDWHLPPHTSSSSPTSTSSIISSTCSPPYSIPTDLHYTTTDLCPTTTTHPNYHITTTTTTTSSSTTSPSSTPYHPLLHPHLSSSSSSSPPYHISKPHPESHDSSTSTSLKHEPSGDGSISITSSGASIAGSPQEISSGDEGDQKYITPHSYLTPPREDESSLEDSGVATEPSTARHADPSERLRWHAIHRQRMRVRQHADTTNTSEDSPRGNTTKLSVVSRKNPSDFRLIETIPSVISQTSITSNNSSRGTVNKLSKLSWTKMSDAESTETVKSPISPVTSAVTTPTVSHSSGESSVSMPDMAEVLRRFGLGEAKSKSSSSTPINEEDDVDSKDDDGEED